MYTCSICNKTLEANETYENKGSYSCSDCLDTLDKANRQEESSSFKENEMPKGTISVELYQTLRKNPNILT
jgi:hypothetical protein